jgi:hypothetical protein
MSLVWAVLCGYSLPSEMENKGGCSLFTFNQPKEQQSITSSTLLNSLIFTHSKWLMFSISCFTLYTSPQLPSQMPYMQKTSGTILLLYI